MRPFDCPKECASTSEREVNGNGIGAKAVVIIIVFLYRYGRKAGNKQARRGWCLTRIRILAMKHSVQSRVVEECSKLRGSAECDWL